MDDFGGNDGVGYFDSAGATADDAEYATWPDELRKLALAHRGMGDQVGPNPAAENFAKYIPRPNFTHGTPAAIWCETPRGVSAERPPGLHLRAGAG